MTHPDRRLQVGVREGGGEPPGYCWSVGILDCVFDEAMKFLSEPQYKHLAMQVKELAGQEDASHSSVIDIRPVEEFYEIRDKGGILGGLNVRVFYGIDKARKCLLILGAITKQNNGPTPKGDKVRMRLRWRKYQAGEYGFLDKK